MSIASAKITINGTQYALSYNSSTGKWEASITAPGATSYNLTNHVYNCSVTATNTAGTSTTVTGSTLSGLLLRVKETVKPTISITSPSTGAYVNNSKQPVVFTITDESGGSGIDLSTLVIKQDGTAVTSYTTSAITNGYTVTYTPSSALTDGSHTVTAAVSDYDGNAAASASTTYTIDTTPPTLGISSPTANLITNSATVGYAGTTNDATSSPVTIGVTLDGVAQTSPTVSSGSFSGSFTGLADGSHTAVWTATDAAGQTTSITRTFTVDTTAPSITAVSITPNPADTGATLTVSVTIS